MKLTAENKKHIDTMTYEGLLSHWRFAPVGDPWFEGETGKYWGTRMAAKRSEDPAGAVTASKKLG